VLAPQGRGLGIFGDCATEQQKGTRRLKQKIRCDFERDPNQRRENQSTNLDQLGVDSFSK
jgi:hypothetical protein